MKKICLIFCLFFSIIAEAKITATFSPNPVKQGDAVELILSSDTAFSGVPNVDVLQKDFVIGGQQRKQSAQWINGKGHTIYQLIYTLFPNKSGSISVQGLKVGNESITPLTLQVKADARYATKGQIDLNVECQQKHIYPAQKMLCTIYLNDSIGLVDGQIIPPQTKDGTWEQVLPPIPIASSKSGVSRYQSTFAFTPKKSGQLEMSPFTFQGEARLKTSPNQFNGIMDFMLMALQSTATQPVGAQSEPFSVTVKEKPANYQGWWLPSTAVSLTESYQVPNTVTVGDPISRTVTLTARDVLADNMPVPDATAANGLKVYTNPEQRNDSIDGGQVHVTFTFVPTQSGDITLPEIKVPWFNTNTEKTELASVPARTIFVASAPEVKTPIGQEQDPAPTSQMTAKAETPKIQSEKQPLPWLLIVGSAVLAFFLGIIMAILLIRHTHHSNKQKKKPLPDLYPF